MHRNKGIKYKKPAFVPTVRRMRWTFGAPQKDRPFISKKFTDTAASNKLQLEGTSKHPKITIKGVP
jgi:hypothetical protein